MRDFIASNGTFKNMFKIGEEGISDSFQFMGDVTSSKQTFEIDSTSIR